MIEEGQRTIARQRRQPEGQSGELHRHRVQVHTEEATLRHEATEGCTVGVDDVSEDREVSLSGRAEWVARLRYAYADTLLDAGRREDAVEWFHRVVAVDGNKATDAEERLAALS